MQSPRVPAMLRGLVQGCSALWGTLGCPASGEPPAPPQRPALLFAAPSSRRPSARQKSRWSRWVWGQEEQHSRVPVPSWPPRGLGFRIRQWREAKPRTPPSEHGEGLSLEPHIPKGAAAMLQIHSNPGHFQSVEPVSSSLRNSLFEAHLWRTNAFVMF